MSPEPRQQPSFAEGPANHQTQRTAAKPDSGRQLADTASLAASWGAQSTGLIDEEARRRFEREWKYRDLSVLAGCLPLKEDPRYLPTLEELVSIDLELSWRYWRSQIAAAQDQVETTTAPLPFRIERYLETFPALADATLVRRLILAEYKMRQRFGHGAIWSEYQQRFPDIVGQVADTDLSGATEIWPDRTGRTRPLPRVDSEAWQRRDYEIIEVLGRGGMGVVFKARQISLKRIVALKMIRAGEHADDHAVARFQAEAEALARLQYPNIVQVYDVGFLDGQPYFTMEFVSGGALRPRLAGVPQPIAASVALVETLARAVHVAHGAGIIHRDLKPENILLTEEGTPKITDFGLAKQLGDTEQQTATGLAVGTPSYMAPEQARASTHQIGPATDVFALGVILYEMLTGRPPFRGDNALETVQQVLHAEPLALRRLRPGIPRDLEAICQHCLEKPPEKRYPTAQLLAEDLAAFLAGRPIRARRIGWMGHAVRWSRRRPAVASLLGLICAVLLGLVSFAFWYPQRIARLEAAGQLDALRSTALPQIPMLVSEMRRNQKWIQPELESGLSDVATLAEQQIRQALAVTYLRSPSAPPAKATQQLQQQLLVSPHGEWQVILEALKPQHRELTQWLWTVVDGSASSEASLRAASALAQFDPTNHRWNAAASKTVTALLEADALSFGTWATALRPVRSRLSPELLARFRTPGEDERNRTRIADLLRDYAAGDAATLAEVLTWADPQQYPGLLKAAEATRPQTISHLRDILHPPADESTAQENLPNESVSATRQPIEQAGGMLTGDFAFALFLPIEQFTAVNATFEAGGYAMRRCRPFYQDGNILIAGIWVRGAEPWAVALPLAAAQLRQISEQLEGDGFHVVDCAEITGRAPENQPPVFAAIFSKPSTPVEAGAFYGSADREHFLKHARLVTQRYSFTGLQAHSAAQDLLRYTTNWQRLPDWQFGVYAWELPSDQLDQLRDSGDLQADISVNLHPDGQLAYSALWWDSPERESTALYDLDPQAHAAASLELAKAGYEPVALSVAPAAEGHPAAVASVWQRQRPAEEPSARHALRQRQAIAAATLINLSHAEPVWSLLEDSSDPSLRSQLIHVVDAYGVSAEVLAQRLTTETTAGRRRALILALGETGLDDLSPARRDEVVEQIAMLYRSDPDAGVHGAAEWALKKLQQEPLVAAAIAERRGQPALPETQWQVSPSGITMIIIRDPQPFWIGSPARETDRRGGELRQRYQIPRSFALATQEVTVEQFDAFLAEHEIPERLVRDLETAETGWPVRDVTWFEAARFCRWLSEQEGIEEHQMCFPPLDEIKPGMQLPEDHLDRTGYRMPTEVEWEYACRAGTTTSRYFGEGDELLKYYAWYFGNSSYAPSRAATLKPNDWGLFDMHGNVWEWCLHPWRNRARERAGLLIDAAPTAAEVEAPGASRYELRGGAFSYGPPVLRSAMRNRMQPELWGAQIGFRVARTVPPPPQAK